ncbi:signal peptidase I [Mycoplasmopsis columboralis]|nr:signal peptidase I [Mycoplasmopsis columboralis]
MHKIPKRKHWSYILILVICLLIITIVILLFKINIYSIDGDSMLPTFKNKENYLIWKTKNVSVGDVIVFSKSDHVVIKKIVAGPHDVIEISENKILVNSIDISEYFIFDNLKQDHLQIKVPEDKYFVLGTNLPKSIDSRSFGFLTQQDIIGKIMFKVS